MNNEFAPEPDEPDYECDNAAIQHIADRLLADDKCLTLHGNYDLSDVMEMTIDSDSDNSLDISAYILAEIIYKDVYSYEF